MVEPLLILIWSRLRIRGLDLGGHLDALLSVAFVVSEWEGAAWAVVLGIDEVGRAGSLERGFSRDLLNPRASKSWMRISVAIVVVIWRGL